MSPNPTQIMPKVVDQYQLICYNLGMLYRNATFFFNPVGNF